MEHRKITSIYIYIYISVPHKQVIDFMWYFEFHEYLILSLSAIQTSTDNLYKMQISFNFYLDLDSNHNQVHIFIEVNSDSKSIYKKTKIEFWAVGNMLEVIQTGLGDPGEARGY